jgi:hypothetical protein
MALAATLTDNFDDNSLNTGLWTAYADAGTSLAETNQRLELTLRANGNGYVGIFAATQYDLTGSYVLVECPDRGSGGSGQTSSLELDFDASNSLKVLCDGTGIMAQVILAGVNNSFGIVTYSAVTHRWWRIREAGGTVSFETSPTGAPGSWAALYSRANPFAMTALLPKLFGGTYASIATPGVPKFDNFNVVGPGQIALPSSDTSVGTWTNQAGGTTNLYQAIDEPDYNDADYIRSVPAPNHPIYEVALGAVTDPFGNTNHTVRVRMYSETLNNPSTTSVVTELRQGASALSTPASWSDALTAVGVPTDFAHVLTSAQADAITNYGDLRLRIDPFTSTGGPSAAFVGTPQSATTAAVTVPWPSHVAGDIGILCVERAGGSASPTLTTANGFVAVPGGEQTTGATTLGTKMTLFWCRATSSAMAAPVVAASADHQYAAIFTARGCIATGNPWDVVGGGVKATASTAVAATGVTTTVPNTTIAYVVARDNDTNGAIFTGLTNAGIAFNNTLFDNGTNSGGGGGFAVATGLLAAAGASGSLSGTMASGILAWVTIALRPDPDVARVRVTWAGFTVPVPPVTLSPTAIASAQALGAPTLTPGTAPVTATGIATAQAFGTAVLAPGPVTVTAQGVASAEAVGAATVTQVGPLQTVTAIGIASQEALGGATVAPGVRTVTATGVASAQALGTALVQPGPVGLVATGIVTREAFGPVVVAPGAVTLALAGIASAQAIGTPVLSAGLSFKRWDGAAWQPTTARRWNGSAWVAATIKRWNGSSWT